MPSSRSGSTIKDVAALAGFSIATVSRAINTPDKVDANTLAAVRAAIEATDYRPSALGRMLRAEHSKVVGVVVPTIANPVFGDTLQGVDEGAAQAGYRLMLMTTEYDAERERVAIDTLRQHRVDGMILTVANASENRSLDSLDQAQLPYVLAHNDAPPGMERASVSVDNFQAAYDGVLALIACGHREIWMLAGTLSASDRAQQRYAGYEAAMRHAGLCAAPLLESPFAANRLSRVAIGALTHETKRPTALFCSNDRLAMVAIADLCAAGLNVPQDMSVIGFDGLSIASLLAPPLASISVPNREIGQRAWAELLSMMRLPGGKPRAPVHLSHTLQRGGTIASPPTLMPVASLFSSPATSHTTSQS